MKETLFIVFAISSFFVCAQFTPDGNNLKHTANGTTISIIPESNPSGTHITSNQGLNLIFNDNNIGNDFFTIRGNGNSLATSNEFLRINHLGNMGIGTTNPETKVHIVKDDVGVKSTFSDLVLEAIDSQIDLISDSSGTWGSSINLIEGNGSSNTNIWSIARQTTSGYGDSSLRFNFGSANEHANSSKVTFKSNGRVGIGTSSPTHKLSVDGGAISLNSGGVPFKFWSGVGGSNNHLRIGTDIGHYGDAVMELYQNYTGGNEQNPGKVVVNGNMGIGTRYPGSFKLAVKGKIRAEEIKVETNWADYVFKEDYDLPTLEEVEIHIKEKGHLINIPSAKEIEENGVQLGEMNKLLLEKIEELTLYTLEQEQKIKRLENDNKKLIDLEHRFQQMEKLLNQDQ